MTKSQKKILKLSVAFAIIFAVTPAVNAMHIMEGYLTPVFCIAWFAVCIPFLVKGFFTMKRCLRKIRNLLRCWQWQGHIFL